MGLPKGPFVMFCPQTEQMQDFDTFELAHEAGIEYVKGFEMSYCVMQVLEAVE